MSDTTVATLVFKQGDDTRTIVIKREGRTYTAWMRFDDNTLDQFNTDPATNLAALIATTVDDHTMGAGWEHVSTTKP